MNKPNPLKTLKKDYLSFSKKYKKLYIFNSFGMSLDGKIATYTGDSKYISNNLSRQMVHELRDYADGILVGINTIKIDHPSLTTRLSDRVGKDAHRVILDSKLSIDIDEPILKLASKAKTYIITLAGNSKGKIKQLTKLGTIIVQVKAKNKQIDLNDMAKKLYKMGFKKLLVEGGSSVHFSFYQEKLVQYSFVTISPLIIGGATAKTAVGGTGFAKLKDAIKLNTFQVYNYGSDIVLSSKPQY
jgi:diaminohydroxyphosphoribosylaminopyrimidine deaminase/5-amino-6-(5-phosphoribosylamino)uracil reductase